MLTQLKALYISMNGELKLPREGAFDKLICENFRSLLNLTLIVNPELQATFEVA